MMKPCFVMPVVTCYGKKYIFVFHTFCLNCVTLQKTWQCTVPMWTERFIMASSCIGLPQACLPFTAL